MSPAARSLCSNSSLEDAAGAAVCHGMPRDATAVAVLVPCSYFFGSGKMSITMVTGNVFGGLTQIIFPKRHERWKMDIVRRETHGHGSLLFESYVLCFEHDWTHLQSTITNLAQSVIPGDWGELIGGVVMSGDDIWHHATLNKQACCRVWARYPRSQTTDNRIWFFCVPFESHSYFALSTFNFLEIWWWYI